MLKESFRVLVALLALSMCASAARADTVNVKGSCNGCWGVITGEHLDAFPMFYSTTSDLSSVPGIGAEFHLDLPWLLVLNAGRFTTISPDGELTISGSITDFDVTFTPVLHRPLVNFWTATDSVQFIEGTGKKENLPQTGATGHGAIGSNGLNLRGTFDFSFDLPEPVPEPSTLLLLSAALLGIAPWVRRHK